MSVMEKVFITGASGGIGSAITKKFYDLGSRLVLTSASEDKLKNLKSLYGDKHDYYLLDLRQHRFRKKYLLSMLDPFDSTSRNTPQMSGGF